MTARLAEQLTMFEPSAAQNLIFIPPPQLLSPPLLLVFISISLMKELGSWVNIYSEMVQDLNSFWKSKFWHSWGWLCTWYVEIGPISYYSFLETGWNSHRMTLRCSHSKCPQNDLDLKQHRTRTICSLQMSLGCLTYPSPWRPWPSSSLTSGSRHWTQWELPETTILKLTQGDLKLPHVYLW